MVVRTYTKRQPVELQHTSSSKPNKFGSMNPEYDSDLSVPSCTQVKG
jgi:hypothetical protein